MAVFQRFQLVVLMLPAMVLPLYAQPPETATPIMALNDVRIGMKGYGLSVFHGTTIEPFPVEVVSIMHDMQPGRSAIWIRCTSERMQKSGPVQGMSGSPIYLWPNDQPHPLGQDGLLIGAFAFGIPFGEDCYVGVQPIEFMREAGTRVDHDKQASAQTSFPQQGELLGNLFRVMEQQQMPLAHTWRNRALAKLLKLDANPIASSQPAVATPNELLSQRQHARTMMLPIALDPVELLPIVAPLLQPMGLTPIAANLGAAAGKPPPGIDLQKIQLEPGSVLAIPLAFGDLDLSAAGTVTDVLPDGRVLAFGHPMFGQGQTRLPMASGFVHFVQPSRQISFKMGGSGVIHGTIVRDEQSGIVGTSDHTFTTAPVDVTVQLPDQPLHQYHYQVVHHPSLTPVIAATVSAFSIVAEENLPLENTMHLCVSMTFAGNRNMKLDTLLPKANINALFFSLAPTLAMMMDNPFESMMLESMNVQVTVEPVTRSATLINGTLDRAQVAPGETVGITIELQPYGQPRRTIRTEIAIPQFLPDGDYEL